MSCVESLLDVVTQCLPKPSEFGTLDYGPMTLSEIRARQTHPSVRQLRHGSIRYSYLTQRGYYKDDLDKASQDAFKIMPSLDGKSTALAAGVFDGHGEYGDDCAGFVEENIEELLIAARSNTGLFEQPEERVRTFFRATYNKLNDGLHGADDFDDRVSGTTAVVALIEDGDCWVANTGDSRAIVGTMVDGALVGQPLSKDHSPFDSAERVRIRGKGGEIMSVGQRQRGESPSDDYWDVDLSGRDASQKFPQPRVWAAGKDEPACAFSRSLGDAVAESLGVICEPDVTRTVLGPEHRFVFLASDGIWEFMSNQEVCDIVGAHLDDPTYACRLVVAEAYRHWMTYDTGTDDITAVLLCLDDTREAEA